MNRRQLLRSALAAPAILKLSSLAEAASPPAGFSQMPSIASMAAQSTFPDPFTRLNGSHITTKAQWWDTRRPEILEMLRFYMYGHPPPSSPVSFVNQRNSTITSSLGTFMQRQVTLQTGADRANGPLQFTIKMYLPTDSSTYNSSSSGKGTGPFPTLVDVEDGWSPMTATWQAPPGNSASPGPDTMNRILNRGWALVGMNRDNITLDTDDFSPPYSTPPPNGVFAQGVFPLYVGYDWGVLAAWAWGCSRVVDYLETLSWVDTNKIGFIGISRGNIVVYLAGQLDTRIAYCCCAQSPGPVRVYQGPDSSFNCGATQHFGAPGWFGPAFGKVSCNYRNNLPFDCPAMWACIAPRLMLGMDAIVYLSDGVTPDPNFVSFDPRGLAQAVRAGRLCYQALGAPINNCGGFWYAHPAAPGAHELGPPWWQAAIDFADQRWFGTAPTPFSSGTGSNNGSPYNFYVTPFDNYPSQDPPNNWTWTAPTLT
jgi:hypothetical protein